MLHECKFLLGFFNDSCNDPLGLFWACFNTLFWQLYNHTLEPIVGPEFWEQTDYPRPLPPLIKPQTGRPKKKRVRQNDIPTNEADPTRLNARVNTMVNCTYCKGSGHNCRTCPSKVYSYKPCSAILVFIHNSPLLNHLSTFADK